MEINNKRNKEENVNSQSNHCPVSNALKIRFARKEELEQVNKLRKQVNDLHVAGKPDVFNLVSATSCGTIFLQYGKIPGKIL